MFFPRDMTFQYFFFDTYIGYFLQVLPIALIAGGIYAVYKRKRCPALSAGRVLGAALFVCYLAALLSLTLFIKLIGDGYYRLFYHMPGGQIYRWFTFEYQLVPDLFRRLTAEQIGNLVMYLPFGLLYPLFHPGSSWRRITAAGVGTSVGIELLQPVFGRSFDSNDIILNGIGVMLSAAVFCLLRRLICRSR